MFKVRNPWVVRKSVYDRNLEYVVVVPRPLSAEEVPAAASTVTAVAVPPPGSEKSPAVAQTKAEASLINWKVVLGVAAGVWAWRLWRRKA